METKKNLHFLNGFVFEELNNILGKLRKTVHVLQCTHRTEFITVPEHVKLTIAVKRLQSEYKNAVAVNINHTICKKGNYVKFTE